MLKFYMLSIDESKSYLIGEFANYGEFWKHYFNNKHIILRETKKLDVIYPWYIHHEEV